LENITVLKYSKLKDVTNYDVILKHLNPSNKFVGKQSDFMRLPYSSVKYCLKIINQVNNWDKVHELFEVVFGCTLDEFNNATVVEFYAARNYIVSQIKTVIENEARLSEGGSVDITKWEQAGGKRLEQFNDFVSLDPLAERYSLYPFELAEKPYSDIFYLQAMVKTLNEVNFNYTKQ
jgi:hypothetical protein